jgi:hypothetical protein
MKAMALGKNDFKMRSEADSASLGNNRLTFLMTIFVGGGVFGQVFEGEKWSRV